MTTRRALRVGNPAVLVPLPTAAADHQTANARALERAGGAVVAAAVGADGGPSRRDAVGALAGDPRATRRARRRRRRARAAARRRGDRAAHPRARRRRRSGRQPRARTVYLPRRMSLLDSSDPRPAPLRRDRRRGHERAGRALRSGAACARHRMRRRPAANADLARLGIAGRAAHDPAHVDRRARSSSRRQCRKDHPGARARTRPRHPGDSSRRGARRRRRVGGELVGIAGTHGKTTTTVMTTEALTAAGPRSHRRRRRARERVGGESQRRRRPAVRRRGRRVRPLVPRAVARRRRRHEHRGRPPRHLHAISPTSRGAFAQFVARRAHASCSAPTMPAANALPHAASDRGDSLRHRVARRAARRARICAPRDGGTAFDVGVRRRRRWPTVTLRVPGRHNVLNALAALGAGLALGADGARMAAGLAPLRRRRAPLPAARRGARRDGRRRLRAPPDGDRARRSPRRALAFPGGGSSSAFQPHLFTRTRDFARGVRRRARARPTRVFLTEIYPAREQPLAGVTSELDRRRACAPPARRSAWRGDRAPARRRARGRGARGRRRPHDRRRRHHADRARAAGDCSRSGDVSGPRAAPRGDARRAPRRSPARRLAWLGASRRSRCFVVAALGAAAPRAPRLLPRAARRSARDALHSAR